MGETRAHKYALKVLLKSAYTKQLFGDTAAMKVLLEIDPALQKVIEIEASKIAN